MKNFIVLYHAPAEIIQESMENTTPEEQAKSMEGWMAWAKKCGDGLVDLGAPLTNGQRIAPDGQSKASTKDVLGYSILQADNIDAAKDLMTGHPHLSWNGACSIEIHETMPTPGM